MMKGAVANIGDAIGNTPLVRLNRLTAGLKADVYCKLGYMNPGLSVKDRIALHIINQAEKRGDLKPGGTIIEATSGNTGMGLAIIAASRGYKCIFVMADKQSMEKVKALRAVGAQVVICPTNVEPEDPRSYYSVAARLVRDTPNAFYANQYHNPDNPDAHYHSTGPEVWRQTGGELDAFVSGLGTGGTITGTGRYLKERKPEIQLVGADILGSVYTDFWRNGTIIEPYSYKIEGIGEDFFPSTIDLTVVDKVYQFGDKESFHMTRQLARSEGLLTGGSGGTAVLAAIKYAEEIDRAANIVVVLPDSSVRYLNKIFDDDWMRENGFLDPEEGLGTIRELLASKSPKVYACQKGDKVKDVVALMKTQGISQVPVLDGNQLIGIVNEGALLERLVADGHGALHQDVETVASNAYEVVDPDAPVGLFNQAFSQGKVIVVWERGEVRGLVTKIDVIDYLSHRRRT